MGIPIISIVDSNSSPEDIDYIIPSNDDSRSTAKLITTGIVKAFLKGKKSVPLLDDIEDDFVEVDAKGKISYKRIKRKRKITVVEQKEPENKKPEDNSNLATAKENKKINLTSEPKKLSVEEQEELSQEASQPSSSESTAVEVPSDDESKDEQDLDQSKESGVESDQEKS